MHEPQRTALVTGAAVGIGASVASRLAARGVRVLLADRDPAVEATAQALRAQGLLASHFIADLEFEDQVLALARHATTEFGGCDILVNNAGINPKLDGKGYPLEKVDLQVWNRVLAVDLTAPFLLCRELVPGMRERKWGRVVNVSSRAGRAHIGGVSVFYSASKAGLIGLTRQLAGEYARDGVTLNCVAPGPVETPLALQTLPEVRARVAAAIPLGRSGTADEIAATIDFLASEQAGYICGACLDVNGGGFMG